MNGNPIRTEDYSRHCTMIAASCTHCGRCERECAFLQRYGDPGTLAGELVKVDHASDHIPFSCSLCGLCREICPHDLDMAGMFLALRREIVSRGRGAYPGHRPLLRYERLGTSRLLSGMFLPQGCDTVYFPGCALPGGRPTITRQLVNHLQKHLPKLGVVLNCCGKPSHDLGREEAFSAHFEGLKENMLAAGIRRVLVNCPNCYSVFKHYAEEFEVVTVYQVLADIPLPQQAHLSGAVIPHDPCVMRREADVQKAVRTLLDTLGEWVDPVKHTARLTRCCGEGGAVHGVNPRLAETWAKRHAKEAHGERLVTYCAGCAHQLGRHTPTSHILDLLFEPTTSMRGELSVYKAPFSYLLRWLFKQSLRRRIAP